MVFVHDKDDIILAMSIIIGSLFLNSLWMFFYYIKLYGWIKFEFDIKFWKELLKSSIPIAVTIFITILYNNFSIFLLGSIKSDYETGIYVVAFKVLTFVLIPTGIIQYAFMPQLARSQTIEEKLKFSGKYILLTLLFGTIITAGFFTFSEYITITGFGKEYYDSVVIVQLLMVAGILAYVNVSYTAPLLSWNYEKKVFWAMAAGGIVNISINLILVPSYGAIGAGIASICTEFTVMIGLGLIIYSAIKKTYLVIFFNILLYALVSCLIGYYLMENYLPPFIAGIISLFTFVIINIVFRTITVSEIKDYLGKN
jgi:O-antigen/teichoic acid export membrane protein